MSGGKWDYCGRPIREDLQTIAADQQVRMRWPLTAKLLDVLGDIIYDTEHAMDWDLSGDSKIADDSSFDGRTVKAFLWAIMVSTNAERTLDETVNRLKREIRSLQSMADAIYEGLDALHAEEEEK